MKVPQFKPYRPNATRITVVDQSHDYSMLLRYTINANMVRTRQWFDIVDNTELDF